jgi:ABC-type antimicrobial peptide transport system permease subunit
MGLRLQRITLIQSLEELDSHLTFAMRAMVVKQAGFIASVGCFFGLVVAIGFSRVAEVLLFGLSARDPAVLTTAAAVLSIVAFAAGYLPARRASGISPMSALRWE